MISAGERQVEICQARFKEGTSPCFRYKGEDDLEEIREGLEANGKAWGKVLAVVSVHGADTEPGTGGPEPCSVIV